MRIDIVTIFPAMVEAGLAEGVVGRARTRGALDIAVHDLRAFTTDRHHVVDDVPFGGGPGMVMTPQPLVDAIDEALYRQGIPPESVQHLLFTFSGNSPQALLTQALQAYPGPIGQWGIGLHVNGHAAFVGAVYDRVIADANNP